MRANVAVATARVLDDPRQRQRPGRELLVMDDDGVRDVERVPAGIGETTLEVDLLAVYEVGLVHEADRQRGVAADGERAGLAPVHRADRLARALHVVSGDPDGRRQRARDRGKAPGGGLRSAIRAPQGGNRAGCALVGGERLAQRGAGSRAQFGVLVEEQTEATVGAGHQVAVVERLAAAFRQRDQGHLLAAVAHRLRGAVVGGVVEDQHLGCHR